MAKALLLRFFISMLLTASAQAAIEVRFVESAPKDRFIITNTGSCTFSELILVINLAQSAGRLIFDTTGAGAGVEVFQPFEVTEGKIELVSGKVVKDGDTELALRIKSLAPGARASFTIDVDDTLPRSELGKTRVAASEISGGTVRVIAGRGQSATAVFDDASRATVALSGCP